MRLTKAQKREILPHLQKAVQAIIDRWEAEREIEAITGKELDEMGAAAEPLAVTLNSGSQVTLAHVDDYLSLCVEVK